MSKLAIPSSRKSIVPSEQRYIGDYASGRSNNFDFLRLLAAALVIFSHAYAVANDRGASEPLIVYTHGKMAFGTLAVDLFFIMSGFLITASFVRSKSHAIFWKARILRIFPGLVAAVIFTAFVLGPIVTSLPVRDYLLGSGPYRYLGTVSLWWQPSLPGVFEKNPLPAVNGSLWTLVPELWCYLTVAAMGSVRLLRKWVIGIVCVAILTSSWFAPHAYEHVRGPWQTYLYFLRMFSFGVLFYLFRDRIPLDGRYAAVAAVGLVVSNYVGLLDVAFTPLCAYLVFYLAYSPRLKLNDFARRGDFSYGTYIYAFPVQQAVTHFFGGRMEPWLNFAISLPIVMVLAFASWHIVESRCIRLKNVRIFGII